MRSHHILSHTHVLTHTRSYSVLAQSHAFSLIHSHTHFQSHTHVLTHTCSLTHSHTLSVTHTFSLTHVLTHSHVFIHTHLFSHKFSLTHMCSFIHTPPKAQVLRHMLGASCSSRQPRGAWGPVLTGTLSPHLPFTWEAMRSRGREEPQWGGLGLSLPPHSGLGSVSAAESAGASPQQGWLLLSMRWGPVLGIRPRHGFLGTILINLPIHS